MTAHATVDTAVEAMKLGAYDYIAKPFDMDELLMAIERINEVKEVKEENKQLRSQVSRKYDMSSFIGKSPETHKVLIWSK
jgi:two-component system, NtrC family, response regulator PilR